MRVIGGQYRSRKLAEFGGQAIRPTADRTRESLFNILRLAPGARFLDAFCGSGAVGIEAVSRGAECVFLDVSPESAKVAEKNFALLGIPAKVLRARAEDYLAHTEEKFDVIFLDPPYRSASGGAALEIIGKREVLKENGVAVFEHEEPFTGEIAGLQKKDERKYGRAYLTFFKKENRI